MRRHLRTIHPVIIVLLLLSLLQPTIMANAAFTEVPAGEYGTVIDRRQAELAPGAVYTWTELKDARGQQQMHSVEFNPKQSGLALRAGTKNGKVYGM